MGLEVNQKLLFSVLQRFRSLYIFKSLSDSINTWNIDALNGFLSLDCNRPLSLCLGVGQKVKINLEHHQKLTMKTGFLPLRLIIIDL